MRLFVRLLLFLCSPPFKIIIHSFRNSFIIIILLSNETPTNGGYAKCDLVRMLLCDLVRMLLVEIVYCRCFPGDQ